ncbi:lysosomal aspartic protease [Drosophila subpulchrella]|uniref:lysosomal aspartic protease n=1 Tax=Drosophila subpulchrella TaxID=1486046 RepID=UPI0018A192AB|nr:lysosomal aspartic protease [Drosophila subpulchrella]
MRCRIIVLCALICLFVILTEARQKKVNRAASRSLAARNGNKNQRSNVRQRNGNKLSARSKNPKKRRLNAGKKNKKSRNLAKKNKRKSNSDNQKAKVKSSSTSSSSLATLPLDFQQNFVRTTDNLRSEKAFLARRYGFSFAKTSGSARLKNTANMEYTCKLNIGTPKQKFTMLPDTGSSNLWVTGPNCKSKACRKHKRYRPKKSSTYIKDGEEFDIAYDTGALAGFLAIDTVSMAGLAVTNQTFAMSTKEPGSTFTTANFDGILGMGYTSISVDGVTPLVQNMCAQDVISPCRFAICMKGGGSSARGGAIFFGNSSTSAFSGSNSYTYTPVTQKGYWQFTLQAVYVGSTKVSGSVQAIVDSGTSLMTAPTAIYKKINKILGCKETSSGECWMKCSTDVPDVTIVIGNTEFVLKGKKMMMKVKTYKGKTVCISVVTEAPDEPMILGDAFIRHFCTVFDLANNRIGFAATTYKT